MATNSGRCSSEPSGFGSAGTPDPIKALYPMVNEEETPLPRCWSSKDKFSFIGLSQNNLRVHYKGHGKTHKDAASVRATHPIPAACGLYYYEVKIVSKGRDGYMGIGLSAQGVNMNRLPGWDKNSYGYHGDDGHSFCSSGTGQPYGPTFTTGDVIGCGINLIENTCFYTKNGHFLGVAFTDLPPMQLYPTVGLQTPGEVVDANFGQAPFVFDIGEMMREQRSHIRTTIKRFPVPDTHGEWQTMLHKMVSTYLVHHGYCATAEAFARSTSQDFDEELTSIKNRQKIQKLVLAGRMGEGIETVQRLYPGLLENDQNLLFMLKVRQFIEMVNGTDSEVRAVSRSPRQSHESSPSPSCWSNGPSNSNSSSVIQLHTSVIQSTKSSNGQSSSTSTTNNTLDDMNMRNAQEVTSNSSSNGTAVITTPASGVDSDAEMECIESNGHSQDNGHSNGFFNGYSKHLDPEPQETDAMDVEGNGKGRKMCGGNPAAMERMLGFGRELQRMSQVLRRELGKNEQNKKMLQDAFSLLAYNDPWNSPVGWQLDPIQREPVCQALNSAILESHQLPRRPPLEICVAHAKQLISLMSRKGLGSCAFASVESILNQ
ncbi:ran-binding protein M isoform X2 [Oratosquilla oratoria]|uniref:ran-binding protein M isoform X2 n=1 Tax=Oratosquilla oratoria TaxID=337810 RepID=UPI003F76E0F6